MDSQSGRPSEVTDFPKHGQFPTHHWPRMPLGSPSVQYSPLRKGRKSVPDGSKLASKVASIGQVYSQWRGTWIWETASATVAIACFACIVGILLTVNDKPVPNWPSGLSVNAILSVLVTVIKGAVGVTIAECLSQLKWSWFKQQRKLVDLSTFNDASRGV